jgi:hypothetical protein
MAQIILLHVGLVTEIKLSSAHGAETELAVLAMGQDIFN